MGDSWSSWSGALRCLPWSGTSASKAWQSGSPELRIVDRKLSDCSQRRSWISVPGEWRAVHRSCTAKTSVTKKYFTHMKKYLPWACRRSRGPRRRCRSCTWCPGSTGSRPRPCHSWSSCTGAWRSIPPDSPCRQQRGNKHDPRPLPRHRYYSYVFYEQQLRVLRTTPSYKMKPIEVNFHED